VAGHADSSRSPRAGSCGSRSRFRHSVDILRDVRGAAQFARDVDEFPHVVGFVRADCPPSPRRAFPLRMQHQQPSVSLGSPVGLRCHGVYDEAVAILDQQMAQIRQPRLGPVGFPILFRVRMVVDACVSLVRVWPRKFLPSPSVFPSLR